MISQKAACWMLNYLEASDHLLAFVLAVALFGLREL
jgi:hypothetical protein